MIKKIKEKLIEMTTYIKINPDILFIFIYIMSFINLIVSIIVSIMKMGLSEDIDTYFTNGSTSFFINNTFNKIFIYRWIDFISFNKFS